jgi:hypothetical protein
VNNATALEAQSANATALAKSDPYDMDIQRVLQQTIAIQRLMGSVLKEKEHYGEIPGVKPKPGEKAKKSLFKSGAEKLCLLFRLRPKYDMVTRREEDTFLFFEYRCSLFHIPTGELWGEGHGSINSREDKYLHQCTAKVCPLCGSATIIKGKDEYGGGWLCHDKKGGCGAKFKDGDRSIESQTGKVTTEKVWNLHNTLIKMGQKRAHVAAVLTATAASDIFTQDLEDLEMEAEEPGSSKPPVTSKSEPKQPKEQPKVTPNQIRDLNTALADLEIGINDRLVWVNAMLAEKNEQPVANLLALDPAQADRLIKAAKAGEMPKGGKPGAA